MSGITPFEFHATDAQLNDLRRSSAATRWPERETVEAWSEHGPLERPAFRGS